jgi:DNA-binding transcriptional LysR family regulator
MQAQYIIPDLRSIRSAIASGLGYSILPDYLCSEWIAQEKVALILKPTQAVTNQIWLAYRRSERQSQQTTLLLTSFDFIENANSIEYIKKPVATPRNICTPTKKYLDP